VNNEEKYKWPMSSEELANILGIKGGTIRSMKSRAEKCGIKFVEGEDFIEYSSIPTGKSGEYGKKWTKNGAIKIAQRVRTEKSNNFLKEMGVDKYEPSHRIESEYIDIIKAAIKGHTGYIEQYTAT